MVWAARGAFFLSLAFLVAMLVAAFFLVLGLPIWHDVPIYNTLEQNNQDGFMWRYPLFLLALVGAIIGVICSIVFGIVWYAEERYENP